MTDSKPWWFSGADADSDADPDADPGSASGSASGAEGARGGSTSGRTFDLLGLASGAQLLVDMAKQAIWAPHTEHGDPAEHGSCIICRALVTFDDLRQRPGPSGETGSPVREVHWIDLDPPVPG